MPQDNHIALQTGDIQTFEALFNTHYAALYNYAASITKNQALAQDAVSEVFLKLWEGRHTLVIEKSLKSYLFKSVYHQCLNMIKHTSVKDQYRAFFLHHLPTENEEEAAYPLAHIIEHEINDIVQKTVAQLPEQCRRIFVMSRFDGLKHEKIAQQLGISINTVRTQIRRALEKLRVELKDFLCFF